MRKAKMWYGSTKSLLESIVRWLKSEAPHDDSEWQLQIEIVQACLSEMVEMSKSSVNSPKTTSRYVHRPAAEKLNRAILQVRSMLGAMAGHDRMVALALGETTIQRL
ncbi:MAG TPA: hypothetical protein VHW09_02665 [Bryobacteraceae bacterium]|jgi:hypothetical protein|nr:hypothetical protein [Bryobacteraceae bacterium]